jgi:hypothetical protein
MKFFQLQPREQIIMLTPENFQIVPVDKLNGLAALGMRIALIIIPEELEPLWESSKFKEALILLNIIHNTQIIISKTV